MNNPPEIRRAIRAGRFRKHTAGLAPGYVQGNVCILPLEYAPAFLAFCRANPKPCPLLAVSAPGDPRLPELGSQRFQSYPSWRTTAQRTVRPCGSFL